MSVHTTVNKPGIYFITFTCHKWLPLLQKSNAYEAVYRFFTIMNEKGNTINGYVIMPNHIHLLLHYKGSGQNLNTVIGNGKRFMAYEIIKGLQQKGEDNLLNLLKHDLQDKDRKKGQQHCVWKDSFDVKECRTEAFVLQKLNYMHLNPVSGKWRLAETSITYEHSSALYYYNGRQRLFHVQDYRTLLNWETMYSE